uniref:Uncharacterized protein n=1 Tax=Arundo donax TaxID=35708 RepID=A0A0A8XXS2_ARUDO
MSSKDLSASAVQSSFNFSILCFFIRFTL